MSLLQMCSSSSLQGAIKVEHPNEVKVCSALDYICYIYQYRLLMETKYNKVSGVTFVVTRIL